MRTSFAAALLLLAACAPMTGTRGAIALDGTSWKLADIGGQPAVAGDDVTLQFVEGHAEGNAGCNRYRAPFTTSGTELTLGPAVATKRACVEAARNAQEAAVLRAMASVASYAATEERLTLRDAAGTPLLQFTRVR